MAPTGEPPDARPPKRGEAYTRDLAVTSAFDPQPGHETLRAQERDLARAGLVLSAWRYWGLHR